MEEDQAQDHSSPVVLKARTSDPDKYEWAQKADSDLNLLVSKKNSYMPDPAGRLLCLGHSSTWTFSQQVLSTIHHKAYPNSHFWSTSYAEGEGYTFQDMDLDDNQSINLQRLPSQELSLFLLQAVKFHVQTFYHLFEEPIFTAVLEKFYAHPTEFAASNRL